MTVKVGVNGFGRIGRNFFRAAKKRGADIDFVAVNDITDSKTLAHLLKYDSVLGRLDAEVKATDQGLSVGGDDLRVTAERDPANLPWKGLKCQVALESHHVNLVPGSAFGAEGYVRLSFAASREQLNGGLDQLEKLLA